MAETRVQPDQGEETEPWDYQEGGGEAAGGAESPQMEQTFPPPSAEAGGGGATQAFAPWLEILIEVGMVLLKKAQDQGLVQPEQVKQITERHGIIP